MFPLDGNSVDQLLTCAEIAMYKVKDRGHDGYYFFNNIIKSELQDRIIMDSSGLIINKLQYCRDIDIGIALDDFGTGYSSLAYLRDIPITTLKIDKLFIDDLCDADKEHTITNTIISLGNNSGVTIIAEGVETKEQLEYLEKNDCHKIQGIIFQSPSLKRS